MTAAEQITEYLTKQTEAHTAAEIAEATGVNKATVERKLRDLREAGTAQTVGVAEGNAKTWALTSVQTGEWTLDVPPAPTEAEFDSLPVLDLGEFPAANDAAYAPWTQNALTEAEEDFMIRHGMTEAEYRASLAERAADGADDEGTRPAEFAGTVTASGKVVQYDPNDPFSDDDPEVEHGGPDEMTTDGETDTVSGMTTDTAERKPRAEQVHFHKRGELEGQVLAFLAEHSDEAYSPHNIAKTGVSGTGAVAYALEKLTKVGKVTQVTDKPKTYQHLDESQWPPEPEKPVRATRKSKKEAAEVAAE